MLGFLKSDSPWEWAAFGKHPVARDFFSLGSKLPIISAFSSWLENGYQMLNKNRTDESNRYYSWRFWIKCPKKDMFICGVGKDSSDKLGRHYPFLVMGAGTVKKGEKYWDLMPFACESPWRMIEQTLNPKRSYRNLDELEQEVRAFKPPSADWSDFENQRGIIKEYMFSTYNDQPLTDIDRIVQVLSKKSSYFILLKPSKDSLFQAARLHGFIRYCLKKIPNAVFIGGPQEDDYMAVFNEPPSPMDLKILWSASKEKEEYGSLVFG